MPVTKRFRIVLEKDSDSETTTIVIPFDAQKVFGTRARVPVRGTINGFAFRSSIFPMGEGRHYMVVNKAMREGAKARAGDTIRVVLQRDDEPREVSVPKDLAQALKANKAAQTTWKKLSYSHRREHVKAIEEAKKPETRARRIEKTIEQLSDAGAKK